MKLSEPTDVYLQMAYLQLKKVTPKKNRQPGFIPIGSFNAFFMKTLNSERNQ